MQETDYRCIGLACTGKLVRDETSNSVCYLFCISLSSLTKGTARVVHQA